MIHVSQLWRNTVKLSNKRHYQIAHEAGVHPSTLSRILNGIDLLKPQDTRVIAVGRVLGIPRDKCFEKSKVKELAV